MAIQHTHLSNRVKRENTKHCLRELSAAIESLAYLGRLYQAEDERATINIWQAQLEYVRADLRNWQKQES